MPRHQKPWREDVKVLTRLPEVERLHLSGLPNTAIARTLHVAEGTIREDLKRLAELWRERIGEQQEDMRARITAELDDARRRALAAAEWDQDCERAVLFGEDAAGKPVLVERDLKGSAQYRGQKAQAINVARQASMDKAKLNGLVVEKLEHGGEGLVRIYERGSEGRGGH